jgi:transposase
LVAYAGIDVPPFQSGSFVSKDRHITKRGSKYFRKVGYEIMAALMTTKPQSDNEVYLFICRKKAEGKY